MAVNPLAMQSLESKPTFEAFEIIESYLIVYEEKIEAMKEAQNKTASKSKLSNKNKRFSK